MKIPNSNEIMIIDHATYKKKKTNINTNYGTEERKYSKYGLLKTTKKNIVTI